MAKRKQTEIEDMSTLDACRLVVATAVDVATNEKHKKHVYIAYTGDVVAILIKGFEVGGNGELIRVSEVTNESHC